MSAVEVEKPVQQPVIDQVPVPLTIEGSSILHQMKRVRWSAWRALPAESREAMVAEAASVLSQMENRADGQSALFSLLGHKGDLLILHFRRNFEELNDAELQLASLQLSDFLEDTSSYLSM